MILKIYDYIKTDSGNHANYTDQAMSISILFCQYSYNDIIFITHVQYMAQRSYTLKRFKSQICSRGFFVLSFSVTSDINYKWLLLAMY